ncbi:tRNA endonuclease ANKZF1-like isoform X3 [Crassostrea virginica]
MSDKKEPPLSSTIDQVVTPPDRLLEEIREEVKTRTPKSSPKRLQKRASKRYWTVHFYNSTDALSKLTGLTVANCNPTTEHNPPLHSEESGNTQIEKPASEPTNQEQIVIVQIPDRMACNSCGIQFQSREEQKEHFKSDWHRYNLQRKLKGKTTMTEDEFDDVCESVSSISGSDSDSETEDAPPPRLPRPLQLQQQEEALSSCDSEGETGGASEGEGGGALDDSARKYPKIFFRNAEGLLVSVYRCVIHHKKVRTQNQSELISLVRDIPEQMKWAVLMCGGGHFAGAVFDKENLKLHKTFHRYVVRAKRGTAQGTRDSQGNAPKSAGASIRRHNEAALREDIKTLLESWKGELASCNKIFIRAPGGNRRLFLHGKSPPFNKEDERIRMIPFPTRRPTLNEVRRVFEMLSSIECYGDESDIQDFVPISPPVTFNPTLGQLEVITKDPTKIRQRRISGEKSNREASPLATEKLKEKVVFQGQQIKMIEDEIQSENTPESSSAGSTTSAADLVETMEAISTLELQEFEATPRRKKNKNRKRRPSKHQEEPDSNPLEEEKYHLKNSLFTACKTGDVETLRNLLAVFSLSVPSLESPEKKALPVAINNENLEQEPSIEMVVTGEHAEKYKDMQDNGSTHTNSGDNSSDKGVTPTYVSFSGTENLQDNLILKDSIQKPFGKTSSRPASIVSKSEELLSPVDTNDMLNEPIGDNKYSLLHIAAREGHRKVIRLLLEFGANPAMRDKFGQPPYTSAKDKECRNEFRKFMGQYPDRYDYKTAQIPSALTNDMELERKQKVAERRKQQKKAKQERLKEQREDEATKEAEEREKKRFLALSDREKRALAAEKRLLKTLEGSGQKSPVLRKNSEH